MQKIKDFMPQDLFPIMLPASFWERLRKEIPNLVEEHLNIINTPDVTRIPVFQLNQHKNWMVSYMKELTDGLSAEDKAKVDAFNEKAFSQHLDSCIAALSKRLQENLFNYIKIQCNAGVPNNAIALTEKTFDAVLEENEVVLVDFWAAWCAPCKALTPTINQLIAHYKSRVYFGKVDIDQVNTLAQRYQVQSLPTILMFKNGTLSASFTGNQPFSELKKALDGLLES